MKGARIGISHPMFSLPDRHMTAREALCAGKVKFSFDDVLTYWPSGQIEQELVFQFFERQMAASQPFSETEQFSGSSGRDVVYCEDSKTTCTMAVEMARLLLSADSDPGRRIQTLIYYSSTMSSKTAWSTPCRLQSELGLRGTDCFAVTQKGAVSSFAALQVAASMLIAEDPVRNVLLVGSERLIPPYRRSVGGLAIQGDSASAMFVSRTLYDFQLCALLLHDRQEPVAARPGSYPVEQVDVVAKWIDDDTREILDTVGVKPQEVTVVLPPHLSDRALREIGSRLPISQGAFFTKAVADLGFLGSSDLVAGLNFVHFSGRLRPGDLILAFGFSGGLSVASCLLRYQPYEEPS
jgi:3-oxoacyl-[acyl-carrier-protein] synthase-3